MSELPPDSALPHVEEADILSLVSSEILDPSYKEHWDTLASSNPWLARAILRRALIESGGRPDEQQRLISMALFVSEAIAVAIARTRTIDTRDKTTSDDGEDLRL